MRLPRLLAAPLAAAALAVAGYGATAAPAATPSTQRCGNIPAPGEPATIVTDVRAGGQVKCAEARILARLLGWSYVRFSRIDAYRCLTSRRLDEITVRITCYSGRGRVEATLTTF